MVFDLMELKLQRVKNGYTQKDMGKLLEISPSTYNKKENGETKISIEEFANIIDIFGLKDANIFFKQSVDKKQQRKEKYNERITNF